MANTITITQNLQTAMTTHAQGKIISDGNAVNVSLGFVPSKVVLYLDSAAGAPTDLITTWLAAMATTSFGIAAAAMATGTSPISAYTGDSSNEAGFTIAATYLANTDVVYFEAWQ